jgi:hypothetical protein
LSSNTTIFDWLGRYTRTFYNEVGVVGHDNHGGLVSVWDEALTNAPALPGEYLRVYKRKTEPASVNAH